MADLCKKIIKEGSYTFDRPANVYQIGSFASNTQIKTSEKFSADICVEIGESFFNERDYLNYRYFIKRSLYLGHTYLHLMNAKRYSKLKYHFESDFGAVFKPLMCMLFEDAGLEVRIHFVPSNSAFKLSRFNPGQCNVRRDFFSKNICPSIKIEDNSGKNSEEIYDPTPNYNFEVLSDLTAIRNNQIIMEKFSNSKNLLAAVKMVKLWLLKRELNKGSGCFDNFSLNMLFLYLLYNRQINPLMSPYQIFRLVLINLSEANWDKKGISLRDFVKNDSESSNDTKSLVTIDHFHQHYAVVFLDSTGFMNITSKMSIQTFHKLKFDAKVSLSLLNDESVDNFDKIFIEMHQFSFECDSLIKITPSSNQFFFDIINKTNNTNRLIKLIENFNNSYCVSLQAVMDVLSKALENRTNLIFAKLVENLKVCIVFFFLIFLNSQYNFLYFFKQ